MNLDSVLLPKLRSLKVFGKIRADMLKYHRRRKLKLLGAICVSTLSERKCDIE